MSVRFRPPLQFLIFKSKTMSVTYDFLATNPTSKAGMPLYQWYDGDTFKNTFQKYFTTKDNNSVGYGIHPETGGYYGALWVNEEPFFNPPKLELMFPTLDLAKQWAELTSIALLLPVQVDL